MEVLRLLAGLGGDIHVRTLTGGTPVHIAARVGHPEALRALASLGADLLARKGSGWLAVQVAATCKEPDATLEALVE